MSFCPKSAFPTAVPERGRGELRFRGSSLTHARACARVPALVCACACVRLRVCSDVVVVTRLATRPGFGPRSRCELAMGTTLAASGFVSPFQLRFPVQPCARTSRAHHCIVHHRLWCRIPHSARRDYDSRLRPRFRHCSSHFLLLQISCKAARVWASTAPNGVLLRRTGRCSVTASLRSARGRVRTLQRVFAT